MDAQLVQSLQTLAIALGLGMLVGLQRESAHTPIAGLRTFGFVTVLGALCGLLSVALTPWITVAVVVALTSFAVVGNFLASREGRVDPGTTTEVAMILMFLIGVYLVVGSKIVGIVMAAVVAVLLQMKDRLQSIVTRLGERDVEAIMRFALLSLVILPVLPDTNFGPYGVLNLYETWLMVVLIVGLGLGGYIAYKFFGENAGVLLGGILGGAVSSTATTVTYSRRAKQEPAMSGLAATVIIIASSVVWIRLIIEIGVVAPSFVRIAIGPMGAMLALTIAISAYAWAWERRNKSNVPEQGNPSELKSALAFGALYALILVAVAWAKDQLGSQALYGVAVLAGLTDVDAITLSTSRLVSAGRVDPGEGWRIIVLAILSNTVFKLGAVALLGSRRLLAFVAASFGIVLAAGIAILLLWP